MTEQIGCGDGDFGQVAGQTLPTLPVAGQPMDRQDPHRTGRTVAVHVKIGGHPSMVPVAAADVPGGQCVVVPGSVIVIPIVVCSGDDESLLDQVRFVGIAIYGVGVQVGGV